MTSLIHANGFFASAFAEGFFRLRRPRSISQTLVPVLAFVAFANLGCTSSIAAQYPHLDRRSVCVLPPGTESDATEVVFTEDHVPVSNLHPEIVDSVAPTARTVFLLDPNADPSSTRYLPAPYNELTCPERFSILPSKDAETPPLPEASLELVVHEQRPDVVPQAVTEKLANCVRQGGGQLKPITHTVKLNAYLTNEGRTASAYVEQSTLGNRQVEACMVNVLRTTSWPGKVEAVAAAPAASGARAFFAQPAPVVPQPDSGPESGIRRIQPQPAAPPASGPGGGFRPPRIFVIPINPLVAAAVVFGIIYFWSETDTPAWVSELNPITREPYTSLEEYDQVQRLSLQQILAAQRATAAAAKPTTTTAAPPVTGTRRNPGQTCDDSVLDELEKQKEDICTGEKWTCSNTFEKIGKKKEKLLTCAELLPRVARGQACLKARLRVQTECYAGSPEPKHEEQIETIRQGVKECVDKAAVRGPGGGPCQ